MSNARNKEPLGRLLTVEAVAEHCAVSVKTVRRWIEDGTLPIHRFGRAIRISESDLAALIRRCRLG